MGNQSAGKVFYNKDAKVMQYCDDTNWVPMGEVQGNSSLSYGLIGHWMLDDTSGAFVDSSGNSNDGTNNGGVQYASSGIVVAAAGFDGVDDEITLNDSVYDELSEMTVCSWIYNSTYTGSNSFHRMVRKGEFNNGSAGWGLYIGRTNGQVGFYHLDVNLYQRVNGILAFDTWGHFCGTYDSASVGDYFKFFYNGVEQAGSELVSSQTGVPDDTGLPITIGSDDLDNTHRLDDVRIYDRILAQQEIQKIYELSVPKTIVSEGLVGYWKLDETSGSDIIDYASSNDGTALFGLNPATRSVSGPVGRALDLSDTDDLCIGLPNGDVLFPDKDNWSVSLWFNASTITTTDNQDRLFNARNSISGSNIILSVDNNALNFYYDASGPAVNVDIPGSITTNRWYKYAVSYDGSDFNFYLNGQLVHQVTDSLNTFESFIAAIGCYHGNSYNFDGAIDDVRIYDRAITADEVRQLYESRDGNLRYNEDARVPEYFNSEEWIPTGAIKYVPHAVEFDGTAEMLQAPISGLSDGKTFTTSFWVRPPTEISDFQVIYANTDGDLRIALDNGPSVDGLWTIYLSTSSPNTISDYETNDILTENQWSHVLISVDSGNSIADVYINGAIDTPTAAPTFNTVNDLDFTRPNYTVGGYEFGGDEFYGSLADLWFDAGTYINFSSSENRQKFIDLNGNPVFLGNTGELPTGSSPDIFLSGEVDRWHENKGTGGGFTENGALTASVSRPGDCSEAGPFVLEDTYDTPGNSTGDIFATDTHIFLADNNSGLQVYSFDGINFTSVAADIAIGKTRQIYYDGNYLYSTGGSTREVRAYDFDGSNLTLLETITLGGSASGVHSDGTYVYVGEDNSTTGTLHALTFNGVNFTSVAEFVLPNKFTGRMYNNDTHLFVGNNTAGLRALSFDGISFTSVATYNHPSGFVGDVVSDGDYLYAANGNNGMLALSFDGSSFTFEGYTSGGSFNRGVYTDGRYVFAGWSGSPARIRAYDFDGANFNAIGADITFTDVRAVSGDGEYIYAGEGVPGLSGISGFGSCRCDAPIRDAGTILYNADGDVMQYCDGESWQAIGK